MLKRVQIHLSPTGTKWQGSHDVLSFGVLETSRDRHRYRPRSPLPEKRIRMSYTFVPFFSFTNVFLHQKGRYPLVFINAFIDGAFGFPSSMHSLMKLSNVLVTWAMHKFPM